MSPGAGAEVALAGLPLGGVLLEPHRAILLDALGFVLVLWAVLPGLVDLGEAGLRLLLGGEAGFLGLPSGRVAVADLVIVRALRPSAFRVLALLEEASHAADEVNGGHVVDSRASC